MTLATIGKVLFLIVGALAGAWLKRRIAMPLGLRPTRRPRSR